MFNKVILVGRLTRDPEAKMDKYGKLFSTFTIAVDRGYNDETDFFDCMAFKNSADFVNKYLTKGRLVLVEGSITINKWISQSGEQKQKPQIVANRVIALESKKAIENEAEAEEDLLDDDPFSDLMSDDSPLGN